MTADRVKFYPAILLLIAAVFVLDRLIPADVSASVLYVVPILLMIALGSKRLLIVTSAVAMIATTLDYFFSTGNGLKYLWSDELLSLLAQLTTSLLVFMQLRARERERAMYDRAEQERQRLALVHSVTSTVGSSLDLDEVLKSLAERMASLFRANAVIIWLADETGSELRPGYSNSDAFLKVKERFKSVKVNSSEMAMAQAVRKREVIIVGAETDMAPETREALKLLGAEMGFVIPLFARERLVGAISIVLDNTREINKADIALVETLSTTVAIALENAQLFGNANKQREQMASINEIGRVFASTLDLQTIYLAIRERLRAIVDCETMLVSLYDPATESITCGFAYTDGEVLPPGKFEPLKLGGGPHSECIRKAKPIIVDNITRQHPGRFRYVGHTENYPLSIIYVPMIAEEKVIGVIQAQSLRESAYTEAVIPLLSTIANQAAIAVQNARLYRAAIDGRQAMELANQMKDEFLAMLSHELRTPLTPILGWTKILAKLDPYDLETRNHALEVIERNTRLQAQLVNDLLDLSRIGSGKITINPELMDLNKVARAAIESHQAEAEKRGIRIESNFADSGVFIMADPARLEQVITNLLTNSIKFSNDRGLITITTGLADNMAVLAVSDKGIGLDAEFLPFVFEKFRQADSSTKRRHGGLGLGLSIVKSLVEMHGGTVSAFSAGLGHGATFKVLLPLAVTGAKAANPAPQNEITSSSLQPKQSLLETRLLIIEDDPDTLEMMQLLCDSQKIKVFGAHTAEKAFEMLNGCRPDIIISDITLPGMDGHELARRLRADERLMGIPMIAITGFASEDDRHLALDAGFDAHLPKPINYNELFELIRQLISTSVVSRH